MIAMFTIVAMAQAQDVYTAGCSADSEGDDHAAVFKNNTLLFESSKAYTYSAAVLCDPNSDNVYWTQRDQTSSGSVKLNINNMDYFCVDVPSDIYDLYWETEEPSQTPSDCLYSVGWIRGGDDQMYAAVWKGNDATPLWSPGYESGIRSEAYEMTSYRSTENDIVHLYCGYQDFDNGESTIQCAWVWQDDDTYCQLSYDWSYAYGIDYYDGNVYTVGCVYDADNDNWRAVVWCEESEMYELMGLENGLYLNWRIQVVGGTIYVCGTDGSTTRIWRNEECIYTFDGESCDFDVNSDGVYVMVGTYGSDGCLYKDGQLLYPHLNAHNVNRIYVSNQCQSEEACTLPYFEGFEAGETDWECFVKTDEDINYNDSYTYAHASYWHRSGGDSDANPYSGDYCAKHTWGDFNQEGWLISPRIELQLSDPKLSFMTYEYYYDDCRYEGVWVSTSGTNPSDFVEVWHQENATEEWKEVNVDLSAYQGHTIYLAFKYAGENGHNWYIDDIAITGTETPQFTISVKCNPNQGSVYGDGVYPEGTSVQIYAVPNAGLEFDKWDDGNTDNPRNIVVTEDKVFVAYFKTTGVDENKGIAMYPNPTDGIVKISSVGMSHITMVNVLGQVIYDADIDGEEMNLDMTQYEAGIYMVRVATENGVSVQRLTVAR